MKFTLVPNGDLTPDPAATTSQWTVSGPRPGFELVQTTGDTPSPGWHVVSTDLGGVMPAEDGVGAEAPALLNFASESGLFYLAKRPIPVIWGRRARVINVPLGTASMELEVSPWLDVVSGTELTLQPVPSAVAATLMAADVARASAMGNIDRAELATQLKHARNEGGNRAAVTEIAAEYDKLQSRRYKLSTEPAQKYQRWRERFATLSTEDEARLTNRCDLLADGGPLISVVVPVHDPEISLLEAAIESVRSQTYTNWQLCLVNDASSNADVARCLDSCAESDDRILVHHREQNGHIAAATNDALSIAAGEFIAFMDHDDLLAPFALASVALESQDADVIYTDEDKVDSSGRHYDPHFKPSWNPELLLGQNYISHLSVIRRTLLDQVGGLRTGFDGSQDHDLMLRVTRATSADRIRHIPIVAYHWRATKGSTALAPSEKNYTADASIRALTDLLGDDWSVDKAAGAMAYRCVPPLSKTPLVSIIIPTRDHLDLVIQCVESLAQTSYPAFEILIVDNDSAEPETLAWLADFENGEDQRVIPAPGPFNYSAINNLAAASAKGDLLLLLNNDTEVIHPDWLDVMVGWILQENVGAVGAKLLYPNDTIQHAGVVLGLGGLANHGHVHEPRDSTGYFNRLMLSHEVGAATAACLLTWRSTWEELGGLEEDLAVAFNDVDYCMRVRHVAKQRIVWTADAVLYHHESISRGTEDDPVKVARHIGEVDYALGRWSDTLGNDPAYSPNLSLENKSFILGNYPRVDPPWAPDRSGATAEET